MQNKKSNRKRFAIGARVSTEANDNLNKWLREKSNLSMPVLMEIFALDSKRTIVEEILSLSLPHQRRGFADNKILSIRVHESLREPLGKIKGFSATKLLKRIGISKKLFNEVVADVKDFSLIKEERDLASTIANNIFLATKNEEVAYIAKRIVLNFKKNRTDTAIHLLDFIAKSPTINRKGIKRQLGEYRKLCKESKKYKKLYRLESMDKRTMFVFGYHYLKVFTVEQWLKEKSEVQEEMKIELATLNIS